MAAVKGYKAVRFVERAIERAINKGLFQIAREGFAYCSLKEIFGNNVPIISWVQRPYGDSKSCSRYKENIINAISDRSSLQIGVERLFVFGSEDWEDYVVVRPR